MKWMCYGAGLLVAIASLLAGTGPLVALIFAVGAAAVMAWIARRVLDAAPSTMFMRSAEGSLLQGVAMYMYGGSKLGDVGSGQPLAMGALALFVVGWGLEVRQRSSYAPED